VNENTEVWQGKVTQPDLKCDGPCGRTLKVGETVFVDEDNYTYCVECLDDDNAVETD
jgi:hypothetical protein